MKNYTETICDLEYIIANCCYNDYYYDGYYRYPVSYGKRSTSSKIRTGISRETIHTMYYVFGTNQLYIGEALIEIIEYLSNRYDENLSELSWFFNLSPKQLKEDFGDEWEKYDISVVAADIEYIIASKCYNDSYNIGEYRYPLDYQFRNRWHRAKGNMKATLSKEDISSMQYAFGSNTLFIGNAILKIIDYFGDEEYIVTADELISYSDEEFDEIFDLKE